MIIFNNTLHPNNAITLLTPAVIHALFEDAILCVHLSCEEWVRYRLKDYDGSYDHDRLEQELRTIHTVARINVAEIRAHTGLTRTAFSNRFCIPRRLLENWESGHEICPNHTRFLLAELCGLITIPTNK